MIYNKHLYVRRIRDVALRLEHLAKEVIFVGGAVVALYADDPAAEEVRPTDDIDIVVGITTRSGYAQFEEKIRKLGFKNVLESHFLGRYKIDDIIVDVMPTDERILGFSNKWYTMGMEQSVMYDVGNEVFVRILPFHYFIASKIEAHNARNRGDFRQSKDFEDIVYAFDNRLDPLTDIQQANGKIKDFLSEQMTIFFNDFNFHEGVYSHLNPANASVRIQRIKRIWSAFLAG